MLKCSSISSSCVIFMADPAFHICNNQQIPVSGANKDDHFSFRNLFCTAIVVHCSFWKWLWEFAKIDLLRYYYKKYIAYCATFISHNLLTNLMINLAYAYNSICIEENRETCGRPCVCIKADVYESQNICKKKNSRNEKTSINEDIF